MARKRYSIKESIQRLLLLFRDGAALNEQPNTIPETLLSEDESWSDVAELFNGSLPGYLLTLPPAWITAILNAGFLTGTSAVALLPGMEDVSGTYSSTPITAETYLGIDAGTTGVSVELPNPSTYNGYRYWIKKLNLTGQINIYPTNGGLIDDDNVLFVTEQYNAVTLIAHNGNWFIV